MPDPQQPWIAMAVALLGVAGLAGCLPTKGGTPVAAVRPIPIEETLNRPAAEPAAAVAVPPVSTAAAADPLASSPTPLAPVNESAAVEAPPAPGDLTAMVEYHNQWRRKVKVPDLVWSQKLAAAAADWANQLVPGGCAMEHRPHNRYGENLAWAKGGNLSPEDVVELWADENEDYDHAKNACAPGATCGHYTQMVWASTREVGCGMARCDGAEIWVCNYQPAGNIVGRKPY